MRSIPTESDIPMHGFGPYDDIHRERIRAHAKHAPNGGSMEVKSAIDSAWLPVLGEEFGEVCRCLTYDQDKNNLRNELVQLAAMACAWIDAIDNPTVLPGYNGQFQGQTNIRRGHI